MAVKTHNKTFKAPASWLGPPLRRFICALIAQINQLRYGPLMGRYIFGRQHA
jgi:hypothetical protein